MLCILFFVFKLTSKIEWAFEIGGFLWRWYWHYTCDASIDFFWDFNFFALTIHSTIRKRMAAWNVLSRFSRVSVRIICVPSYTVFGSNWALFRSAYNSEDDIFKLFREFSAIRSTIIFHVMQWCGRVVKVGRWNACRPCSLPPPSPPPSLNSEAVRRKIAEMATIGWIQNTKWSWRACGGSRIAFVRGPVVWQHNYKAFSHSNCRRAVWWRCADQRPRWEKGPSDWGQFMRLTSQCGLDEN